MINGNKDPHSQKCSNKTNHRKLLMLNYNIKYKKSNQLNIKQANEDQFDQF